MSMFKCDQCTLTLHYNVESPDEHKPVQYDFGKTCCFICYQEMIKSAGKPILKGVEAKMEAVVEAFRDIDAMAEFMQNRYPREWRAAYQEITGEEWK